MTDGPIPTTEFTQSDQPVESGVRAEASELERALFEVKRVIVGQDRMVERILVAMLSRGHLLLEGPPGVAKTLAAETVATVMGGTFRRIQFTSDLVPADIIGTRIYRPSDETFGVELGPVFANIVLTDEINRAPAKVQSALLEVMSERQVSLGGVTHPLPRPFVVLATQNPIESEGVYHLPEAQRDRFLMRVEVPYPNPGEERAILARMGVCAPRANRTLTPERLVQLQHRADDVFVHPLIADHAVHLVLATRDAGAIGLPDVAGAIAYGASPRGTLGLIAAARALAVLRGRDYLLPTDVRDLARDVLAHRIVLSFDALADGTDPGVLIDRVLAAVPEPRVAPQQDTLGAGPMPTTELPGAMRVA